MKLRQLTAAAAMLALGSSAYAGNLVASKTVDLKFDGFCDGMHLFISQASGVVSGNVTGCVTGRVIGTVGGNSSKGIGITVMSRTFLYVIDDLSQTWQLYTSAGTLLQSGTWSVGVPALAPAASIGSSATGQ